MLSRAAGCFTGGLLYADYYDNDVISTRSPAEGPFLAVAAFMVILAMLVIHLVRYSSSYN